MVRRIAIALLLLAVNAQAATRYVDQGGSGTSPFDTVEKAATGLTQVIVGSLAGDTVLVSAGTYSIWSADVVTNLNWVGVDGPENTIIDGAMRTTYTGWLNGGGLSGFTVCNFTGNYGAVLFYKTSFVSNCIITKNRNTRDFQGVLTFYSVGTGFVDNCRIENNSSSLGGAGVAISGDGQLTLLYVNNCTISNNVATGDGGGVACGGANNRLYVDHSIITYNSADEAGAAYCQTPATSVLSISNSVISFNSCAAGKYSGGTKNCSAYNSFYFGNKADLIPAADGGYLYNCAIIGNSGNGGTYGAIYYNTIIENCIIWYNYPFDVGRTTGAYSNSCYGTTSAQETPPPGVFVNCLSNIPPVFVDDYATALATPSAANCGTGFVLLASGLAGLKLQVTSPCIGTGTNQAWMVGATDYGGVNDRIYDTYVDMGAWEYTPEAAAGTPDETYKAALLWWRARR